MARKFKLGEKACQLGSKFTSEGEGEGEKREDSVGFSLEGLMLNAKELDKILGEGSHERLFVDLTCSASSTTSATSSRSCVWACLRS